MQISLIYTTNTQSERIWGTEWIHAAADLVLFRGDSPWAPSVAATGRLPFFSLGQITRAVLNHSRHRQRDE